jgi:hypothetical protein
MKAATFEFFWSSRRLQVGSLSVYMLRFSVFGFFSLYKVHRPLTVGWGFRGCYNYIGGGWYTEWISIRYGLDKE